MSNPSKITRQRLEGLIKAVRHELSAFQLGMFTKEPIFGVVDVPLFGLRFKFITNPVDRDADYTIINIVKEEDVNTEQILLALASNGYLRWLRMQISTHAYLKILTKKDRWKLIIETALEKAKADKRGDYLTNIVKDLKSKPLMQIYHEDPEVFDWLLK